MKSLQNVFSAAVVIGATTLGCQSHEEKVAIAMQSANERCDTIATLVNTYAGRNDVRAIVGNCSSLPMTTAACRRNIANICYQIASDTDLVREAVRIYIPAQPDNERDTPQLSELCHTRLHRQITATTLSAAQSAQANIDDACQFSKTSGRLYDYTTGPYRYVDSMLDDENITMCPHSHIRFNDTITNSEEIDTSNRFYCYVPRGK